MFLAGEVEAELDGTTYTLRPGRRRVPGVGSRARLLQRPGTERVRWLETQAPQPPVRHAYRWAPTLEAKFEEDNDVG